MMPEAGTDEIYGTMAELAKKQGIPVFYAERGDIWKDFPGKGMKLECLSPDGETEFADRNEESLVFRLTLKRFSLLLTEIWKKAGRKYFWIPGS